MSFWKTIRANLNKTASIAAVVVAPVEPANDTSAPVAPAVVRTCQRVRYTDLQHKAYVKAGKHHEGKILAGHHADVYPKDAIRLYGYETNAATPHDYNRVFVIGDEAAYGGWNITYTGKIVAIGEKVVKIKDGSKTHAVDIATFSVWNKDFDAVKVAARNASKI